MCDRVTPPSHVFWDERGANGNAIPVFVVEEHREAYLVISYAIKTGLLPPHGNALVHIDEHHDLGCPVLLGPARCAPQAEPPGRLTTRQRVYPPPGTEEG